MTRIRVPTGNGSAAARSARVCQVTSPALAAAAATPAVPDAMRKRRRVKVFITAPSVGQIFTGVEGDRDELAGVGGGVLQHRAAPVGPGADPELVADRVHPTRLCGAADRAEIGVLDPVS